MGNTLHNLSFAKSSVKIIHVLHACLSVTSKQLTIRSLFVHLQSFFVFKTSFYSVVVENICDHESLFPLVAKSNKINEEFAPAHYFKFIWFSVEESEGKVSETGGKRMVSKRGDQMLSIKEQYPSKHLCHTNALTCTVGWKTCSTACDSSFCAVGRI